MDRPTPTVSDLVRTAVEAVDPPELLKPLRAAIS